MKNYVPTSAMLNIQPKAVSSPVKTFYCESDILAKDISFESARRLLEAYEGKPLKDEVIYA
jgi:hypothetical protein